MELCFGISVGTLSDVDPACLELSGFNMSAL